MGGEGGGGGGGRRRITQDNYFPKIYRGQEENGRELSSGNRKLQKYIVDTKDADRDQQDGNEVVERGAQDAGGLLFQRG